MSRRERRSRTRRCEAEGGRHRRAGEPYRSDRQEWYGAADSRHAAPIRDDKTGILGSVLVFRDVTEQRKAEQSARFLASIVESSNDAIIGKDVTGVITNWNQAAERLFGYAAAEAIGRPIGMLAPPDGADDMAAILNSRIEQGERVEHFDTVRLAKDGRLVPISLTVSPIKDEAGVIVGASKTARDITERKRAEEALREEKARLHTTLVGIGDAVIVTDAEGRVTMMNPVAQTLTGWKDDATGRPLEEVFRIVDEQTRQPVESPVTKVIREGTVVGLANHTPALIGKDGTERPDLHSAAPIRDQNGRIVGVVMVFRDVKERLQVEAEQERLREELAAKEAELQLVISRTPLLLTPVAATDATCSRTGPLPSSMAGRRRKSSAARWPRLWERQPSPRLHHTSNGCCGVSPSNSRPKSPLPAPGGGSCAQYTPDRDDRGDVVGWSR